MDLIYACVCIRRALMNEDQGKRRCTGGRQHPNPEVRASERVNSQRKREENSGGLRLEAEGGQRMTGSRDKLQRKYVMEVY